MKTNILVVSYLKDKPWLEWCLKSIKKFCTGFGKTSVVVPQNELKDFYGMDGPEWFELVGYERVPDKRLWHLAAQTQKCFADQHCPDADFILHTDSDCIFTEPITPDEYFHNGKPIMLIEEYSRMKDSPWKKVTEDALKIPCQYETMRRHPQVNPRGIYEDLRAHIELVHNMPFDRFVLSRKAEFPWGFSEHNAIGAFALQDKKWNPAYHWIDVGRGPWPKEKLEQFWSLGDIDKPQGSPHTHKQIVPLEVIKSILG